MKRGERKYETRGNLKFNTIYTTNFGSVIQTKGSAGFRIVDNDFNHVQFAFDQQNAEDFLDAMTIISAKKAA